MAAFKGLAIRFRELKGFLVQKAERVKRQQRHDHRRTRRTISISSGKVSATFITGVRNADLRLALHCVGIQEPQHECAITLDELLIVMSESGPHPSPLYALQPATLSANSH